MAGVVLFLLCWRSRKRKAYPLTVFTQTLILVWFSGRTWVNYTMGRTLSWLGQNRVVCRTPAKERRGGSTCKYRLCQGDLSQRLLPGWQPRCPIHISQKNCWIKLSTSYTTQEARSRIAASSLSHGFRVLESTFSPASGFTPGQICNHGKIRFRTLPPPLHATHKPYSLTAFSSSQPPMQKRVVGSQHFPASCTSRQTSAKRPPVTLRSPLSHSTDSHLSSNPFA